MTVTTKTYKASDTLAELSTSIRGDEVIGPLQAVGHTATASAATFEPGRMPATSLVLVDAGAPAPAGTTKICEGYVWNAGQPAHVIAYRLPPAAPAPAPTASK